MPTKHYLVALWISLLAILLALVVGGTLYGLRHSRSTPQVQNSPSPTSSPTAAIPSPTTTPASPTPTVTPSPLPSPTASPAAVLPDSAKSFLANFYASYKARDRDRLAGFFTADVTTDDRLSHSTLFKGVDLRGDPGGPTLFSTNSASQSAASYQPVTFTPQGKGWLVTDTEQRVGSNGQPVGRATTLITIVPATSASGTWLIDSYVHAGSVGKYNGFLLQ